MSSRSLFLSIIVYLIVGELVYLDDCVYDVYKNHSYKTFAECTFPSFGRILIMNLCICKSPSEGEKKESY